MCGIGAAGRPYEQTYPQKLGRGFCEKILDVSINISCCPHIQEESTGNHCVSWGCRRIVRQATISLPSMLPTLLGQGFLLRLVANLLALRGRRTDNDGSRGFHHPSEGDSPCGKGVLANPLKSRWGHHHRWHRCFALKSRALHLPLESPRALPCGEVRHLILGKII